VEGRLRRVDVRRRGSVGVLRRMMGGVGREGVGRERVGGMRGKGMRRRNDGMNGGGRRVSGGRMGLGGMMVSISMSMRSGRATGGGEPRERRTAARRPSEGDRRRGRLGRTRQPSGGRQT